LLFPPMIEEKISKAHPVRVFNYIIDGIDHSALFARYPGGGASSYHPVMLLKILLFAYLNNIYTLKEIEELLVSDENFIWLSGDQVPNYTTINRFRRNKLGDLLKKYFFLVVEELMTIGILEIKTHNAVGSAPTSTVDSSPLSTIGAFSFEWGTPQKRNKSKRKSMINDMWVYIQDRTTREERVTFSRNYKKLVPDLIQNDLADEGN
jgi:Transposase and inactivated derivatives